MKHLTLLLMACLAIFQTQAQNVSVTFNLNMSSVTIRTCPTSPVAATSACRATTP